MKKYLKSKDAYTTNKYLYHTMITKVKELKIKGILLDCIPTFYNKVPEIKGNLPNMISI